MRKFLVLIFLVLTACSHSDKTQTNAQTEVITIATHPLVTTLFYSGIIQPLKTVVVPSPADGVISDMSFYYGDPVKQNQPLFTIFSEKFQSDFKTTLMQYIKAKSEFNTANSQLTENKFLHDHKLISDDDFKTKKSNFYGAQLALIQAKDALSTMLKQLDIRGVDLYQLGIEDIDKISNALHLQDDSHILRVVAPSAGVALLAVKDSSGGEGETKKISKGEQVKQGDVLAVIGDVSGLAIHISVNEFNINQLKVGQKVKVTGVAFPNFTLEGKIAGLDKQGQASQTGMPTFPVEIIIPQLTPAQQAIIHIGMSAKVQIEIAERDQITVPIAAVFTKDGAAYVKLKDQKSGELRDVAVKTGQTSQDGVVIQSGLAPGDQIVVTH